MDIPKVVLQQLLAGRDVVSDNDVLNSLNDSANCADWDKEPDAFVLRDRLTALPILARMEKLMLGLRDRCERIENADSYDPHKAGLLMKTNLDLLSHYRSLLGLVLPPMRPVQVERIGGHVEAMEIVIKDDSLKKNGANGSAGKFVMDLSEFDTE